ncbi:MAG: hypothetical protein BAJALOKI2v1_610024 [Promethearchaeota archaeon]|nr:MAG: hypothetical protein BAJALOKI2v1_610024 [Candidatus Lokiarchaeota archaeon]
MRKFFKLQTYTPWEGLKSDKLSEVKLLSLKSIFKSYPVIEEPFFNDLKQKITKFSHYSSISSIKRIIGPNDEDYDISKWNFIWAIDKEDRMYQFLFQKNKVEEKYQSILVALAPPELAKFFSDYKKEAILRIFSLLNSPDKLNFLMFLTHKGRSLAQELQTFQYSQEDLKKIKYSNILKEMPNIKGEWFPHFAPKCPICGATLIDIEGYRVGFGKLICPKCGYKQ